MSRIVPAILLGVLFTVAACASKDVAPILVTKEVKIPVPVPCKVDIKGQRPALLTLSEMQEKIAAAPNVDTKAQLVTTQLLAYMGWLPVVEAAVKGCEMAPKPGND